jgi:hypothetical protein
MPQLLAVLRSINLIRAADRLERVAPNERQSFHCPDRQWYTSPFSLYENAGGAVIFDRSILWRLLWSIWRRYRLPGESLEVWRGNHFSWRQGLNL